MRSRIFAVIVGATCLSAGIVLAPMASADPYPPYPVQCPPQGGYRITVTHGPPLPPGGSGPITCSDAYGLVARYNFQGPSHQVFGLWSCNSPNAAERSTGIVLQCGGEGSFSVYRA